MGTKQTIVVAGAAGFLGRSLPNFFGADYRLIGLSQPGRSRATEAPGAPQERGGYQWRECDLFSRRQTLDALEGADLAVYMVHSLRPSAALSQGSLEDMDLICADNFARAARHHQVRHIVYVSGIHPERHPPQNGPLDPQLAARLEIEQTLASAGAALTTLRAGIVIGPGSDLIEIIFRLVERLPVMTLPKWCQNRVSPIERADLLALVRFVIEHPEYAGRTWAVGGKDSITWAEILALAAEVAGKKRKFFHLPVSANWLSALWVARVTGQPLSMVRALIAGLRQSGARREFRLQELAGQRPTSLREALQSAFEARRLVGPKANRGAAAASSTEISTDDHTGSELVRMDAPNEVRSVQRLALPPGRDARWVAAAYARWLPRFMRPFIRVRVGENDQLDFLVRPFPWPILILDLDPGVSTPDRQLYWIRGGLLAGRQEGGRFEFREVLDGSRVLAAIHNFRPRLPWPIYVVTQAKIHLFVMRAFRRYLARLNARQRRQIAQMPAGQDAPPPG